MYIEVPVEEWGRILEAADIPELRLTMSGYFGTVLSMLYGPDVVDNTVQYLMDAFGLDEEIQSFMRNQFLPEIRNALQESNIDLTLIETAKLDGNTLSTLTKLIYAFLWQVLKFKSESFKM